MTQQKMPWGLRIHLALADTPLKRFLDKIHRLKFKIIRILGFDRYDIVPTGLKRTEYYDTDNRMTGAIMELTCRYVEHEEDWGQNLPYEDCPDFSADMLELCQWWRVDRPEELKRIDDHLEEVYAPVRQKLLDTPSKSKNKGVGLLFVDLFADVEDSDPDALDRLDEKETEMLIKAVNWRSWMWT